MYKEVFIKDFSALGESIENSMLDMSGNSLLNRAFDDSFKFNPLFTINMQREALRAVCNKFLNINCLKKWLLPYQEKISQRDKTVGIVMAGNLPLVGFHDMLTAMASGCRTKIKLSAKDRCLIPALFEMLCEIDPFWRGRVSFSETLPKDIDLLIATGGEQTFVLMETLYRLIPKITRSSRSSIAVLNGDETMDELQNLATDIFLYYGMGCRSVSTLLLPDGYSFEPLMEALETKKASISSVDYMAAYRYQKAVVEMQNAWYLDGGFYIIKTISDFPPPMGVINVLFYRSTDQINTFINTNINKLQCVVNKKFGNTNSDFGQTQYPSIDEYADGINSLEFILNYI